MSETAEAMEVSVVMPCLNEADTLEICLRKAHRALVTNSTSCSAPSTRDTIRPISSSSSTTRSRRRLGVGSCVIAMNRPDGEPRCVVPVHGRSATRTRSPAPAASCAGS